MPNEKGHGGWQGVTLGGGKVSRFLAVARSRAARWQGVTLESGGIVSRWAVAYDDDDEGVDVYDDYDDDYDDDDDDNCFVLFLFCCCQLSA